MRSTKQLERLLIREKYLLNISQGQYEGLQKVLMAEQLFVTLMNDSKYTIELIELEDL